jgi:hypothetical protein
MPMSRHLLPTRSRSLARAVVLACALAALAALGAGGAAWAASGPVDLGPPDYSGYCQKLGFVMATFTQGADKQWACLHADKSTSPLDLQAACEFSYPQRPILARQLTPGVLFTWQCFQGSGGTGGAGGSAPGGAGTGSNPLVAPQASLLRLLTPTGRTAKIEVLLSRGGYSFLFGAPGAGRLVVSWYFLPRGAHISRTAAKPVLVGSAAITFAHAGRSTVKVRLTTRGRQLLRHARRLAITAKGIFTPTKGASIRALRTFTLSR